MHYLEGNVQVICQLLSGCYFWHLDHFKVSGIVVQLLLIGPMWRIGRIVIPLLATSHRRNHYRFNCFSWKTVVGLAEQLTTCSFKANLFEGVILMVYKTTVMLVEVVHTIERALQANRFEPVRV
jgi:hypothetical protein